MIAGKIAPSYLEIPSVTTTEKNALTASSSMLVYDSTIGAIQYYDGSAWHGLFDFIVDFNNNTTSPITLTAAPNSERVLGNSSNHRLKLDLTGMSQFRIEAQILAASASANTPRIYAQYSTDDSTYQSIGSSDLSLASTGVKDTGWVAITSLAIADNIYVRISQDGGNASANPALNNAYLMFK